MKRHKKYLRDHRLKHRQILRNREIIEQRLRGEHQTVEEQLNYINSFKYEDLMRLQHIIGERESPFLRASIDNDLHKVRRNKKKAIDEQLKDIDDGE